MLVVEDDAATAEVVCEAFADEGHRAEVVPDAEAALARRGEGWDVFVIDGVGASYTEPDDADRTTFARLGAHGPVVVASARDWARPEAAEALGVAAVLAKPYQLDDLLAAVRRAAETRS